MTEDYRHTEGGNVVTQPGEEPVPSSEKIKSHDSSILDLAFAMDCTGSMGSFIAHAQQNIRKIVEDIVCSEKCDVHMALVEYRDHPPQDRTFVTRVQDFTPSVKKMKAALDNSKAQGGGDLPEAVADALHQVVKLTWREESTKICVLISDAPPHGINCQSDSFPNGCPDNLDPVEIVNQMAEKGITLYVVGCEPSIQPYKEFFTAIAYTTGGQYVPLTRADLLSKVIIGGAQEEISLQSLMSEVNQEVQAEMLESDGCYDEDKLSDAVFKKLKTKGAMTRALQSNKGSLAPPTASAVELSKLQDLSEVRKKFKPTKSHQYHGTIMTDSASFGAPSPLTSYGTVVTDSASFGAPSPRGGGGLFSAPQAARACAMAAPSSAPAEDYAVVEQSLDYAQTKRMVKKSMAKVLKKK